MSKNLLSDGSAYSKGVKAGYKIDANNVGMRALFNKLKAHDLADLRNYFVPSETCRTRRQAGARRVDPPTG